MRTGACLLTVFGLVACCPSGGSAPYEVFWREHNAAASLKVEEFEGKMALADVLALARKQEQRIADAAD